MGAQFLTDVKNSVCRVLFFFSLVSKISHLAAACINCVRVSLLAPDLQKKPECLRAHRYKSMSEA